MVGRKKIKLRFKSYVNKSDKQSIEIWDYFDGRVHFLSMSLTDFLIFYFFFSKKIKHLDFFLEKKRKENKQNESFWNNLIYNRSFAVVHCKLKIKNDQKKNIGKANGIYKARKWPKRKNLN